MKKSIRVASMVLARFFLSAVFLTSGVYKIFHWHETESGLLNALCDWQSAVLSSSTMQECLGFLTPWTPLLLLVATLFEIVGALLLLLGVREKLGAALLVLVLVPATVVFHQFWFLTSDAGRDLQQAMFLKNLAILGGLILVLIHGAQAKDDANAFKF